LQTTVDRIQAILGCDRVTIWQFDADIKSVSTAVIYIEFLALCPVMPKRIEIAPHLSMAELEARYRGCSDAVERLNG
ncbi:MAG: hypothetical protein AAFR26_26885, partial [Cyanobacteria bacterium J06626_4]